MQLFKRSTILSKIHGIASSFKVLIGFSKDLAKRLPIVSHTVQASISQKADRKLLGKRVGKCGATTGITCGKVHDGILPGSTIKKLYDRYQIENVSNEQDYSVLAVVGEKPVGTNGLDTAPAGKFAGPGDSGAWIVDSAFEIVGMLFGGGPHGTVELTYFTPLNAILKDVERAQADMIGLKLFRDSTCCTSDGHL